MDKKKFKQGKVKRHKLRQKLGIKQGFGKPWSANSLTFRVEMCWVDDDGEESNEQIHWIECRKFEGTEYQFLKIHFKGMNWEQGETVFSKYIAFYVAEYLVKNKDDLHLNQAFIYPPAKVNDTIRLPLYKINWSENLANNCGGDIRTSIVLKNAIWHQK